MGPLPQGFLGETGSTGGASGSTISGQGASGPLSGRPDSEQSVQLAVPVAPTATIYFKLRCIPHITKSLLVRLNRMVIRENCNMLIMIVSSVVSIIERPFHNLNAVRDDELAMH